MFRNSLISVIVPVYNVEKYLPQCLNSIINQTYENLEIILINDGSTDNTKEIAESFIKSNKIAIRYLYKKNGGKHTAVNYGLKYISTKLTVVLDSDDYFTNDAVEVIKKTYNENKNEENICGFTFLMERRH